MADAIHIDLPTDSGGTLPGLIRLCTREDRRRLVAEWAPALERGGWPDRDWTWEDLTSELGLTFPVDPHWAVAIAEDAGDILGTVVVTGPITIPASHRAEVGDDPLAWLEYIAIAPSIRADAAPGDRRSVIAKGVGINLMQYAIVRSRGIGCAGRIGLLAEGDVAVAAYTRWKMRRLPDMSHPDGQRYPVFFGDAAWSDGFFESGRGS